MPSHTLSTDKLKRMAALLDSRTYSSRTELAKALRVSRTTIHKYSRLFSESGYALNDIPALCSQDIQAALFHVRSRSPESDRLMDLVSIFPNVSIHIAKREEHLQTCWKDYLNGHPNGYGYTQFVFRYHEWTRSNPGMQATPAPNWQIGHIPTQDCLELRKWRRSNSRTKWCKSVAILELGRGLSITSISSKLEKSARTIKRWRTAYLERGLNGLLAPLHRQQSAGTLEDIKKKKDQLVGLLHESPALHGINRASWSLKTLSYAFEVKHGDSIGISTISEYIRSQGYSFKKARKVLTSPDPEYRSKLANITKILSELRQDEAFFSIDEYGPFSVKIQGGRTHQPRGVTQTYPQWQSGKGSLILTGALELSTNQLTHFYSEKKNTDEMIKLLDILLVNYSKCRTLYLSWDAASWHISSKLNKRVAELNLAADQNESPVVRLAPLPASAQFLNVIESVFSGMSKAVIHNSNYENVDTCKVALNTYIEDRNEFYKQNPKRAGNKIWGKEIVLPDFNPSNNCKDPNWR